MTVERSSSALCANSQHKACIGIDIGCACSCHVSPKTLRRERKRMLALDEKERNPEIEKTLHCFSA
jgi:hypothetical protein